MVAFAASSASSSFVRSVISRSRHYNVRQDTVIRLFAAPRKSPAKCREIQYLSDWCGILEINAA
jgi:hypothetical protein